MGRDGRGTGRNRLCDGCWLCCKVMREKVGLEAGSFHKKAAGEFSFAGQFSDRW